MKHILPLVFFLVLGLSATYAQKGGLSVYPNPATDYISIDDNNDQIVQVAIYNLVGKKVKEFEYVRGEHYYVADLPKGMYLVQLIDRNQHVIKTQKVDKR